MNPQPDQSKKILSIKGYNSKCYSIAYDKGNATTKDITQAKKRLVEMMIADRFAEGATR